MGGARWTFFMDGRGWVGVGGHFLWVSRGGLGVGWVGIFLLVGGE